MRIDWFTFTAQIVNFLILIWLLRHYLYGPLLDAMDRREERISSRLDEAREARADAERAMAGLEAERAELAEAKQRMLAEARAEAARRKRDLLESARGDVDRLERAWRESVRRERSAFLEDLSERASSEILATTRRVLRDLADEDLEDRAIEAFIHRLVGLEGGERRAIVRAIREAEREPVIRTRFPLSEAQRGRIETILSEVVEEPVEARFERDADLGFGIELEGGGHRIGWSLASYLGALEERVDAALVEALRAGVGVGGAESPRDSADGPSATTPTDGGVPATTAERP